MTDHPIHLAGRYFACQDPEGQWIADMQTMERCDVCGQLIWLDRDSVVLPHPWRNIDNSLHTCFEKAAAESGEDTPPDKETETSAP